MRLQVQNVSALTSRVLYTILGGELAGCARRLDSHSAAKYLYIVQSIALHTGLKRNDFYYFKTMCFVFNRGGI